MSSEAADRAGPGVPALWWEPGPDGSARCLLCFRACRLEPGRRGFCRARMNRGGRLVSLNYGFTGALSLDPVEKKPLYHFHPGTLTMSVGAPGCNLACLGCQNHDLSRPPGDWAVPAAPEGLAEELVAVSLGRGASSWSFTYSEPTVFLEYASDLGAAARAAGLPSIWVTNGSMNPDVLAGLDLAAMNVDLKGFTEGFYRSNCSGSLAAVLAVIERAVSLGIWVEVTTLLIPGLNDSPAELRELAGWLRALSPDLPWHVSRFFPRHRQTGVPPTPPESLLKAREIGLEAGLRHVYLGNLHGPGFSDTLCPGCGRVLVGRSGYSVGLDLLSGRGACPDCGAAVAGRWGAAA